MSHRTDLSVENYDNSYFDFIYQSWEYLIKWAGWPFHECSWEPFDHLNPALLR